MPGFHDEPPQYSITLLGMQLRGITRAALCCMLLVGIFGAWFMHGYCEERLSRAGEDFPMELLTWIQFTCVVSVPPQSYTQSQACLRRGGDNARAFFCCAGRPLRDEQGVGSCAS